MSKRVLVEAELLNEAATRLYEKSIADEARPDGSPDAIADMIAKRLSDSTEGPAHECGGEEARLRDACAKQNHEVCQILGKALGYPWYKDDQVNFLGAMEADGICEGEHVAESIAAEAAAWIGKLKECGGGRVAGEPDPQGYVCFTEDCPQFLGFYLSGKQCSHAIPLTDGRWLRARGERMAGIGLTRTQAENIVRVLTDGDYGEDAELRQAADDLRAALAKPVELEKLGQPSTIDCPPSQKRPDAAMGNPTVADGSGRAKPVERESTGCRGGLNPRLFHADGDPIDKVEPVERCAHQKGWDDRNNHWCEHCGAHYHGGEWRAAGGGR